MKEKAFKNLRHNKIHLTFPNGNAVSIIWSSGSYTENHNFEGTTEDKYGYDTFMESDTCEIMILNAPDKLYKKIHRKYNTESGNSVIGWLKITQLVEILSLLSK